MRLVFMGTPEFAATVLDGCLDSHDVLAAYARPDAASGRGNRLHPPAVKVLAESRGVPVRQPKTLRDFDEQAALRALAPEAIIVAAYGLILPREVLEIPPYGCINVHASLLPRWRGAAPVQRAILAGDQVTGVSIMRMEEGLDTGPFAAVARVAVDDLDAEALTHALAEAGTNALLDVLRQVEEGTAVWTPQDDSLATYAEKVGKPEVALQPEDPASVALRKVRASGPRAPARACRG